MKEEPQATNFIQFQNSVYRRIITRIYILLIIVIIAFIVSVIDSIYIRNKMVDLISQYQKVTETETYDMDTENGSNYYVGGDNNGKIESN